MKKILYLVICGVLLFTNLRAIAQNDSIPNDSIRNLQLRSVTSNGENTFMPEIVPLSPNAASLGLYGAIPVGHYTGIPDIKIPIYEIDLDGKKFPIALSYHASGIKVAQEASCVGLGWSLSGLGCITKQIRGIDDFIDNMGYFSVTDPLTPEDVSVMLYPGKDKDSEKLKLRTKIEAHAKGLKDGEPDLFHFNFGGYSGTMFFSRKEQSGIGNNKARPIIEKEKSNLNVEFDYSGDTYWKIIDGDGYTYHFRTREMTGNRSYSAGGYNVSPAYVKRSDILFASPWEQASAWYLDSIVSPRNNSIKFKYQSEEIYTLMTKHERTTNFKVLFAGLAPSPHTLYSNTYSYAKIEQQVISEIETPLGNIQFSLEDRPDIEPVSASYNPQRIKDIMVTNRAGDMIKYIELNYIDQGSSKDYATSRFFLKEVIDKTDRNNISYKLTYDTQVLPSKHSNEMDYWGYYNGLTASGRYWTTKNYQGTNTRDITYIPEYQYYNTSKGETVTYLGRKTSIDPQKMKAGSLKSIEYPTGLITSFSFSPNQVANSNVSSIKDYQSMTGGVVAWKNFAWDDPDEEASSSSTLVDTIVIPEGARNIRIMYQVFFQDVNREGGQYEDQSIFFDRILLKNAKGTTIRTFPRGFEGIGDPYSTGLSELRAGETYILKLIANPNNSDEMTTKYSYLISAGVFFDALIATKPPADYGCGLRVDEIISKDPSGKILKKNTYEYLGGLVMNDAHYHYNYHIVEQSPSLDYYTEAEYITGLSTPHLGFSSSAAGSHVGYSVVTEKEGTEYTDAKTVYYYHNNTDQLDYKGLYFAPPNFPLIKDFRNGQLTLKEVYNDEESSVLTTEYTYSSHDKQSIKGVKVYGIPSFIETNSEFYSLDSYDQKAETWRLAEESTHYGYANGEVSSITKYDYSASNDLPAKITTTGSDNVTYQVNNKYPTDFQDAMSSKMKEKNMINVKLETLTTKSNKVVKGEKVEYTDYLGMLLPKIFYRLKSLQGITSANYSSYFDKIYTIDRYSKSGKILQVTNKENTTAYLWSYEGQYPFVEIKNETYDTVEKKLTESYVKTLSEKLFPSSSDFSKMSLLKLVYPQAHITTYTYRPLVGMLTATDSRGVITYYDYDSFGRLKETYIKEGGVKKIIQAYNYHYQNK